MTIPPPPRPQTPAPGLRATESQEDLPLSTAVQQPPEVSQREVPQREVPADLPTMADIERLAETLDQIDHTLAELDQR